MADSNKVPVELFYDTSHLSEGDQQSLDIFFQAAELIDEVYLAQRENGLYPEGLTAEEFLRYCEEHPEEREALESPFTLVEREGDDLVAVSYAEAYGEYLTPVRDLLMDAVDVVSHRDLARFLITRAYSFAANNYDDSDAIWVDIDDAPLEVTIGPYEEYDDTLLGLKRFYEAILGITVPGENARLRRLQGLASEFDKELAEESGTQAGGAQKSIIIIDQAAAAGFTRWNDYVPMAYSLPNGDAFRRRYGSKVVLMRNVMEAKVEVILKGIAEEVADNQLLDRISLSSYLDLVVGHELAHGFGVYMKQGLRDLGNPLEEAKADVFSLLFLHWLVERGLYNLEDWLAAASCYAVGKVRKLRFGSKQAHSFGARLECNWLIAHGALDFSRGIISMDEESFHPVLQALGGQLIEIARSEDYERAKAFIDRWGGSVEGLDPMITEINESVPVDIDPTFVEKSRASSSTSLGFS